MSESDRDPAPMVRIPADFGRPDRVVGPFTARQAVFLAVACLLVYGLFEATRHLPRLVFPLLALPIAGTAIVLAVGQRDGLPLDRLIWAAFRQSRSPRRMVPARDDRGDAHAPGFLDTALSDAAGKTAVSPLRMPVRAVTDRGGVGVLDLGRGQVAALAVCSTINFALRSGGEQQALVAAMGRWLNSLTGPIQIVVRAGYVDLSDAVADLHTTTAALTHPALARAAGEHAAFLTDLAAGRGLLARQVILIAREGIPPLPGTRRRHSSSRGPDRRRAGQAADKAVRRLREAADALAGAEITVRVLSAEQATAVLAAAGEPAGTRRVDELAPPDQIITTTPHPDEHDQHDPRRTPSAESDTEADQDPWGYAEAWPDDDVHADPWPQNDGEDTAEAADAAFDAPYATGFEGAFDATAFDAGDGSEPADGEPGTVEDEAWGASPRRGWRR